ncbi:hypothetical protein ACK3SF_04670 [Candidatus Nanosalina sp. VS9-1]|uniref:hypothetical protein n=1 Tax=Candidatus Nanosalina sp. VS9-1 TaxID=3388566 RepID=UPI0039E004A1
MTGLDRTYGDLLDAAGDDVADYVRIEHERGRGEGTAVIDPDIGGYGTDSVDSLSGLAVEVADGLSDFYQGVHMYDVEGADDRSAEEALEEVIHDLTPDSPSRNNMFADAALE